MDEFLDPPQAADFCSRLGRALEALRLNHLFPPWQSMASHLAAIAILPPGERLRLCPRTGWPHPAEWLRVRADARLAPEILPRLRSLAEAGDAPSLAKAEYLQTMVGATLLSDGRMSVDLVSRDDEGARFQVRLDRIEPSVPSFVRWTLRIRDLDARDLSPDALCSSASTDLSLRLARLTHHSAPEIALMIHPDPTLDIEEIVRGEIGPVVAGKAGPCLTALMERVGPGVERIAVDDPLVEALNIPSPEAGMGYARHRKWTTPHPDLDDLKAWLKARGSRNLCYGYAP